MNLSTLTIGAKYNEANRVNHMQPTPHHTAVALLSLALLFGLDGSARGNLIVNGGFESPVLPPASYQVFSPSSVPGLPGWSVVAGDVDIDSANVFGLPFAGAQWLDLNGQSPGTIEQSFATTPGVAYVLSFFFANNTASGFDTSARVSVLGAGLSTLLMADFSHQGSTTADMDYRQFVGSFVADSGMATLRFESTFYGTSGVALDAVSVTGPEVPEPGSLFLLALCSVPLLAIFGRGREG